MSKSLKKINPYDTNTSRLIVETDRKTMHASRYTHTRSWILKIKIQYIF